MALELLEHGPTHDIVLDRLAILYVDKLVGLEIVLAGRPPLTVQLKAVGEKLEKQPYGCSRFD